MNTTTQQQKKLVFNYIIEQLKEVDTIKLEYGDKVSDTIKDRIEWTINTFKSEQGYNIKKLGLQGAFKEWLQGVPSAIHCPVYYSEILELYYKWNPSKTFKTDKAKESFEDKICANWYNYYTVNFFQLAKKYKVTL